MAEKSNTRGFAGVQASPEQEKTRERSSSITEKFEQPRIVQRQSSLVGRVAEFIFPTQPTQRRPSFTEDGLSGVHDPSFFRK